MPRTLLACCLVAAVGCSERTVGASYEPAPECVEFCARDFPSRTITAGEGSSCRACFGVDVDGQGACRADLNLAEKMELAGVIWLTASIEDLYLIEGEQCEQVLCPLVDAVDTHRQSTPFADFRSFDDALSQPELIGAPELTGIDVRTLGGYNSGSGEGWLGLNDVSYVDGDESPPSCCVGAECVGAEFRCENEALVEVPTACSSLP